MGVCHLCLQLVLRVPPRGSVISPGALIYKSSCLPQRQILSPTVQRSTSIWSVVFSPDLIKRPPLAHLIFPTASRTQRGPVMANRRYRCCTRSFFTPVHRPSLPRNYISGADRERIIRSRSHQNVLIVALLLAHVRSVHSIYG